MDKILVVDDESGMRLGLKEVLERRGYVVSTVENGHAALSVLAEGGVSLVVSDMRMPGMGGVELLTAIQARWPGLPVILITAYGTVEDAVAAMKAGARDFLTKPFSPQDLLHVVRGILRDPAQEGERPGASPSVGDPQRLEAGREGGKRTIVTRAPAMQRVLEVAASVASSRAPVLIQGESGTGKELLARFIHTSGSRANQPFVAVNCAALPKELLESELFGHEKGSFTGAIGRKLGKFELANRGTILLDEISEMEPILQGKLLRVLQEHEVDRVGGARPIPIDARVIATTNRPLRSMVAAGTFRQDLFYRLHVIPVTLPPLRERREDLDLLVDFFLERFAGGRTLQIEAAAREALKAHGWPGNIRELEHVIERNVLLAANGTIRATELLLDDEPMVSAGQSIETAAPSLAGLTVHEVEKRLILDTLTRTRDNRSHAARLLGISVRTLRNKLAEYRLAERGAESGAAAD